MALTIIGCQVSIFCWGLYIIHSFPTPAPILQMMKQAERKGSDLS